MSIYDIGQRPFPALVQIIRDKDGGGIEFRQYFPERTCRVDITDKIQSGSIRRPITVCECSACGGSFEHVYGEYNYCPHCGARVVQDGAF